MHCNYLLTAPFPRGVLKSFWRARKNVSVHQIFWSLPVKSHHEIHFWMYFQWQRELIMFSNESLSPLKALFWTTLHWQLELFDLVLFIFFPSLSPRRLHTSCRKGQATPFWPLVLWAFWQAFENDRVRQILRVFSSGTHSTAVGSQHGKDNLSVFGWLTLNSSKICFVTHSPCPRGLARFPKLFPHSFSSHPRKKKQCFAKNKLFHFSKKDFCCSGIFKPQEFTSGLILANTARDAARILLASRPSARQRCTMLPSLESLQTPQGHWATAWMWTVLPGNRWGQLLFWQGGKDSFKKKKCN